VDVQTGRERWAQNLGNVPANNQIFFHLYHQANLNSAYHPNARFRFYHVKGHLIVCQIGIMAYCLDGDTGKVLWRQSMAEGLENQPNLMVQPATTDADGNPEFIVLNQFGRPQTRIALGQVGAVEASYVALLTSKGLIVNDPLRGNLLWKKLDITPGTRVFGDEQYLYMVEGGEAGSTGAGRVLRATDGAVLEQVADFGPVYQNRLRVAGGRILAADPGKDGVTLRLYDIVAGKDVWAKSFKAGSVVLKTEDPGLTGVIGPQGELTVLDADTGRQLLAASVVHGRIAASDLKELKDPLLLADAERFYVCLNQPVEATRVAAGRLHNNFNNAVRCDTVNGWVVALHRKAGGRQAGDRTITWKAGDLAWHSHTPVTNQLVVLEQFDELPVLLFTARYPEMINGGAGGSRWQSMTQSIHKRTGKWVYHPGAEASNGSPQYFAYDVDSRAGTISLIGLTGIVQHYADDGRPPPGPAQATYRPLSTGARVPRQPLLPPAFPGALQLRGALGQPGMRVIIGNGINNPQMQLRGVVVDQVRPAPAPPPAPKRR
jgi:outer membrane protein assembly factor BamB